MFPVVVSIVDFGSTVLPWWGGLSIMIFFVSSQTKRVAGVPEASCKRHELKKYRRTDCRWMHAADSNTA